MAVLAANPSSVLAGPGGAIPADPWEVIHTAREFGTAEVTTDGFKDPLINVARGRLRFSVAFYGCYLGRDCQTILFHARLFSEEWDEDAPDPDLIRGWNGEKLFGRAHLDDDRGAILEHPVAMAGGLAPETLKATFQAWVTALEDFADHVDFE